MKTMLACFASIALLAGCAAQPVSVQPGAEAVKIGKADPGPGFEYAGEVTGISGSGCGMFGSAGSFAESAKALRNEAHALGATYVQIMAQTKPGAQGHGEGACYRNTYHIDGTAYRTP